MKWVYELKSSRQLQLISLAYLNLNQKKKEERIKVSGYMAHKIYMDKV
jgi:hypothetical protein